MNCYGGAAMNDIGWAVARMREGKRLTRDGWNGRWERLGA